MSRRLPEPGKPTPPRKRVGNGIENICGLCGHGIHEGERLAKRKGNWIHRSCAPGADDE